MSKVTTPKRKTKHLDEPEPSKRLKTDVDKKLSIQNTSDLIRKFHNGGLHYNELMKYAKMDLDWTHKIRPVDSPIQATSLLEGLCRCPNPNGFEVPFNLFFCNFFGSTSTDERPAIINSHGVNAGWTVLHWAVRHVPSTWIKMLLDAGGDIRMKNNNGDSVLITAAFCGTIANISAILDNAPSDHVELDQQVIDCAIEGDMRSKTGAERIKTFMLCKYPVFFNLDHAYKHMEELVLETKLTTADDPNLIEIRAALDVGEAIQRLYVRDVIHLIGVPFIPVLAGIVRSYVNL